MMHEKDRALAARIAGGESVDGPDAVTPGYRTELMRLMVVLVDSELAAAAGFADLINAAPTLPDRVLAARIVSEKFDHAGKVLALMESFGVNPDLYLAEHSWAGRIDRSANLGTRRIGGDKRLNVFHYPLQGWLDALVFELLMGSASVIQLSDQADSSYRPFASALTDIVAGEARHAEQGEAALATVIERSGNLTRPQAAVAYWQPRIAASFGRADSERLDVYLDYGLRKRSNADLLAAWQSEIAQRLAKLGLEAVA
jgi:1,2-phenylacetyl-CoA epoxidase catalytic subunit